MAQWETLHTGRVVSGYEVVMVFDWFKRKFVKKEDAAPVEPSESAAESPPEESTASPSLEDSAVSQQPDYLAWAREFTYLQTQGQSPASAEEAPSQVPEASQELPVGPPVVEPQPIASAEIEVQPVEEVQKEVEKIQQQETQPAEPLAQPPSGPPDIGAGYIEWIRYWEQNSPPVEPSTPVSPAVSEPVMPMLEAVESSVMETVQPTPIAETPPAVETPSVVEPVPEPTPVAEIPPPVETPPVAEAASTPLSPSPEPSPAQEAIEQGVEKEEEAPFWRKAFSWNRPAPTVPESTVTPVQPAETQEPSIVEAVESPTVETIQPAQQVPEVQTSNPVAETPPVETPASPEPVAASTSVEPPSVEEEEEDDKVPFWRKAFNWNRGASTPSAPTEALSSPELIPQEAFDEGFLWSAEVLRAQGRRPEDVTVEEITWLKKLRKGLQRTSRGLVNDLKAVVGKGPISADDLDDIENLLLSADVGVASTERIIDALKVRVKKESLSAEAVFDFLKTQLKEQLEFDDPVGYAPKRGQLNVWLIVGVNGVGKTTTIGKLAHLAQQSGYKTLVAAGDTFRAAAVEQLQEWGRRSGVEVIANQGKNADPAAVVFDGIMAAQARGSELLLVDTAGRLQNKKNLMEELAKIRRIIDKKATGAHIEALLVLDASTGQNGLVQAKVFSEVANLSGVILTKLDGTARGGVALAVVEELKIPIRFIGVGEKINDLRPFNSYEFVEALLSDQS